MKYFVICAMLFMHVLGDFVLQRQGWMHEMKRVQWWREITDDKRYNYDFVPILFLHGFSWSFLVHLPLLLVMPINGYISASILIMGIVHGAVDHLKANRFMLNLIQDQIIHMIQIAIIAISYPYWMV